MTNLKSALFSVAANVFPAIKADAKVWSEFSYWKNRKAAEGSLSNHHYEEFYTTQFGLRKSFYD